MGPSPEHQMTAYFHWLQDRGVLYPNIPFPKAPKEPELLDPRTCRACPLEQSRPGTAYAEGAKEAPIHIAIFAPSREAASLGSLFSRPERELLGNILKALNIEKDQAYFTTRLCCPLAGGDFSVGDALNACRGLYDQQMAGTKAQVTIQFGGVDRSTLGKVQQKDSCLVLTTYSLGALLQKPELKREVWQHLQQIAPSLLTIPYC